MKSKVYLSDEGYGHIARQRAIMEAIIAKEPSIQYTLQTQKYFDFAVKNTPSSNHINRYNNISWYKQVDSSPDIDQMKLFYEGYKDRLGNYLQAERNEFDFDFVLSDFVYEAFTIANEKNKPSFGVAHFTWDWFFSKLYPRMMSDQLFQYFTQEAKKASALFFPPFTPPEILEFYRDNAKSVPFIIRKDIQHREWSKRSSMNILIMDSGAGLMKPRIEEALSNVHSIEATFGVLESVEVEGHNIFKIPQEHLLIDYVKDADLVIGRPGFNTLSECIAYKVPMLLISEAMNPEMEFNISELKKKRLGAFMSIKDFESNFSDFLSRFMDSEYVHLKESISDFEMATNGAEIIAEEILNRI